MFVSSNLPGKINISFISIAHITPGVNSLRSDMTLIPFLSAGCSDGVGFDFDSGNWKKFDKICYTLLGVPKNILSENTLRDQADLTSYLAGPARKLGTKALSITSCDRDQRFTRSLNDVLGRRYFHQKIFSGTTFSATPKVCVQKSCQNSTSCWPAVDKLKNIQLFHDIRRISIITSVSINQGH